MKKNVIWIIIGLIAGMVIAATNAPNAQINSKLTVTEKLTSGSFSSSVTHNSLDEVINLRDGATKWDIDNVYYGRHIGVDSIDMSSLTNTLGESFSVYDERIMAIKFKNISNTGNVTVDNTASNTYPLLGSTYSFVLEPGQSLLFIADTMSSEAGASARYIEFAGSDTCDVLLITSDI